MRLAMSDSWIARRFRREACERPNCSNYTRFRYSLKVNCTNPQFSSSMALNLDFRMPAHINLLDKRVLPPREWKGPFCSLFCSVLWAKSHITQLMNVVIPRGQSKHYKLARLLLILVLYTYTLVFVHTSWIFVSYYNFLMQKTKRLGIPHTFYYFRFISCVFIIYLAYLRDSWRILYLPANVGIAATFHSVVCKMLNALSVGRYIPIIRIQNMY